NHKYTHWNEYTNGIESKLLKYLKLIVLKTECKIVLSTTWRLNEKAKAVLLHNLKTRMDLNTDDLDAATNMFVGAAKSIGLLIKE
ncbi:MAG: hypothetical protein GY951_10810, partial [Psychromonas sp.]|nr:hypothetical protein [Psychromonas sp.]